ncbi:MAG: RNA methyltransferase [Acidobacteria bacterium]|nr:MAG: RNA methyltransferase [Acidobacteriota bacterium]
MAFNEELANQVRKQVKGQAGLTEKKMFGGLAFLINGNMSVGIHGDELIVRTDPEQTDAALQEPGVRIFDLTGRPMKGWILVGGKGIQDPKSLKQWIRNGVNYASSLPRKN